MSRSAIPVIRGVGNKWDDVIIPGLDFVVIENTLGKFGKRVEDFNASMCSRFQFDVTSGSMPDARDLDCLGSSVQMIDDTVITEN